MDYSVLYPIIAGGIRNISGWLTASLEDGKIQGYEWGQLLKSVIEVAVIGFSAMYGLNLSPEQAAGLGILASMGISAVKKAGTK
jgi:hypothetical protein